MGVARDNLDDQQFRDQLRGSIPEATDQEWDEFATRLTYATVDVTSADDLWPCTGASTNLILTKTAS